MEETLWRVLGEILDSALSHELQLSVRISKNTNPHFGRAFISAESTAATAFLSSATACHGILSRSIAGMAQTSLQAFGSVQEANTLSCALLEDN